MSALKAYTVLEDDENTGGVVFARSSAEARRDGSSQFGDGHFNWGKARRAPWADSYAPGPVPFKVLFNHGWWIHCSGCGQRISEGATDYDGDEVNFDLVEVGSSVFCTPQCLEHHRIEKAEEARIRDVTIGWLKDYVLAIMPGALICGSSHVYVPSAPWPRAPKQAYVEFIFPGAEIGPAKCRFDKYGEKPSFSVCAGDRVAFARWRRAGYPPHMMDSSVEEVDA